MKSIHAMLLALCMASPGCAMAQRMSVAPDAFLQDVDAVAGMSAIGSALFSADTVKKGWGDYCSDSAALAQRGEFRRAIRTAAKALYLGESQHGNRGAPVIWATRDISNAYSYAGEHLAASAWAGRTLAAIAAGYDSAVHRDVQLIKANAHRIRALALNAQGRNELALAEIALGLDAVPSFGVGFAKSELQITQASLWLKAGEAVRAAEAAQKLLGEADPLVRLGAARLAGEAALAQGNAAAAQGFFQSALAAAGERKDPYQTVMVKLGLVRALRLAGNADAASAQLTQTLAELENLRGSFRSFEMRTALYGNLQSVFDEAVDFHASRGEAALALASSEASRARMMLDLQAKIEGGGIVKAVRPRSPEQIQSQLPTTHVMVVFHQLPTKLVAWVVTRDGIRLAIMPVAANSLLAEVTAFRQAIEREDKAVIALAGVLHDRLIAPLRLPASARLVLVPHRALHLLPFQALHDGTRWLVERYAVGTSLSASLVEITAQGPAVTRIAAVGNPDLGRPEWELPGAEREVKALAGMYAQAVVAVQKEASKARLAEIAPGAEVVHVAAHVVVDAVDPMFSLIKLATQGSRGSVAAMASDMEARELATLNLSQARLVSLSACNSGLGTVGQGDEFMGFKRALFAAGARSALVSLWPVDDNATELLMTEFHRGWKSASMVDAMQAAQLKVLREPRYRHPYYWAPFTLVGDPG